MAKFRNIEDGETREIEAVYHASENTLFVGEKSFRCTPQFVELNGKRVPFWIHREGGKAQVWLNGTIHEFELDDPRRRNAAGGSAGAGGGTVKAQMPGKILQVAVAQGDQVEVGQNLVLMESMKMELALDATVAGVVKTVAVEPGQMVSQGALLLEIEETKA